MSARKDYVLFHGKSPRRKTTIDFHTPRRLTLLGEAYAIEYKCNKRNGGGDGRTAVYRHRFETPMVLAMDERKGRQLYVLGPELIVTERGIEN